MDSQAAAAPNEEKTIWEGHSSQVINLPAFILCGLAAGALLGSAIILHSRTQPVFSLAVAATALIPLFIAMTKWLQNRCRRYQVTTERIHLRQGVFARKTDELELYRVKDYVLLEPFFLRLFGLGSISLSTSDVSDSAIIIKAVPDIQTLRDQIRKSVEACRTRKGVRVAELE
jgi:uncharacterized membrane protein YdbT with pleckstrin-like domain